MLKENEQMVTPTFIIDYQVNSYNFSRIKMTPTVHQKKHISELLRKKLSEDDAIDYFKNYNSFKNLLQVAVK